MYFKFLFLFFILFNSALSAKGAKGKSVKGVLGRKSNTNVSPTSAPKPTAPLAAAKAPAETSDKPPVGGDTGKPESQPPSEASQPTSEPQDTSKIPVVDIEVSDESKP
jgi:hypothetical protein